MDREFWTHRLGRGAHDLFLRSRCVRAMASLQSLVATRFSTNLNVVHSRFEESARKEFQLRSTSPCGTRNDVANPRGSEAGLLGAAIAELIYDTLLALSLRQPPVR